MDKYYRKLSRLLINNHNIAKEDEELYEYASKVLFQGFINTVLTILIGITFGMLKECVCFISTFIVLRKFTGGLHAKKYSHCLISSVILIIASLFIIKKLENTYQICFYYVEVISVIVICGLAPIENNNKPLLKKEKKIYKAVSIIISLVILMITYFLSLNSLTLSYSVGNGLIMVSFLVVLAYFKEKFLIEDRA